MLTCCAFQLLFGKIYAFYSVKATLLISILIFEVAFAVCGAAPTSAAFIVGRATSGIGSAGIFAGTVSLLLFFFFCQSFSTADCSLQIVCVVHAVPLAKRPTVQGIMGGVMGLATVVGPVIGGAFTSNVTWRWCFYINLPFGGLAMAAIFFLEVLNQDKKLPWSQKLAQLDAPGTALLVPGVVCLLLALQWGGQMYAVGLHHFLLDSKLTLSSGVMGKSSHC